MTIQYIAPHIKLTFDQYPAVHINYSWSNCTISNQNYLNRYFEFLVTRMNVMLNSQCKRRLTWAPKRVDSTNQKRLPANVHAHRDVFQARLPWQEMVKLNKGSIFVITETKFAIQSQVMQQPNCTERLHVDATIMRYFQTELFSSLLPSTYVGHVNLAAAKALAVHAKLERWQHCWIHYSSCLKVRFCVTTVSNIMIILWSGAVL